MADKINGDQDKMKAVTSLSGASRSDEFEIL